MITYGFTEDEVYNVAQHAVSVEVDVSNLLNARALEVIDWQDSPDLLQARTPSEGDLKRRQSWGARFWLTRFALAAHLNIEPEARSSAAAARAWGASWEDVGSTVGLSRQSAQQRYQHRDD